jgi:hypothetical protein
MNVSSGPGTSILPLPSRRAGNGLAAVRLGNRRNFEEQPFTQI